MVITLSPCLGIRQDRLYTLVNFRPELPHKTGQFSAGGNNDVLMHAAHSIVDAVQRFGDPKHFVGHIGGDDFVVISLPERFEKIVKELIAAFDGYIPNLYDPADRERGSIEAENRQDVKVRFPFASLSIAVVTSLNENLGSHLKVSEIAAALKEYAKTIPGSKYVVDQRVHAAVELAVTGVSSR